MWFSFSFLWALQGVSAEKWIYSSYTNATLASCPSERKAAAGTGSYMVPQINSPDWKCALRDVMLATMAGHMTRNHGLPAIMYRTQEACFYCKLTDASCHVAAAGHARPFGPVAHFSQRIFQQLLLLPQSGIKVPPTVRSIGQSISCWHSAVNKE